MAYDKKYRQRVIEYRAEGKTLEDTKKVFKVSITTIREWEQLQRENGHLEKKELNRRHKKIDPEQLKKYIAENPDHYLSEIAEAFGCSTTAVFKALKKHKLTLKKRPYATRSKTPRM